MVTKVFIDTNILLDIFDEMRKGSKDAVSLFTQMTKGNVDICISESVITTFDYVISKSVRNDKRRQIINDLGLLLTILSCTNETVIAAAEANFLDFEDALPYEIAASSEADYFITNDKTASKKLGTSNAVVISCIYFLKLYEG